MKTRSMSLLIAVVVFASLTIAPRFAMAQGRGHVVVPDSSIEHAQDRGVRAHTNHVIFLRSKKPTPTTPSGMSPATIQAAYQLPTLSGVGVIAIVDAYDYPTAASDFDTFSSQYGLPLGGDNACNSSDPLHGNPCFVKVYAVSKPRANCGWAQEAALDIEWAHAMAPYAQIVLVEAKSNSFSDLLKAVDVATNIVNSGGYVVSGNTPAVKAGEVSMSWGGSEFSSEASYDSHFNNTKNVVYFAASGDTGGQTIYPSASPYVVAAGGTTLNMNGNTFVSETGWSGSGGGPSKYEKRPGFQGGIVTIVGSARGIPDMSFDADPYTGVSVYDSTSCQGLSGWLVFGGTSVASPSLSGIVNSAATGGTFASNSVAELSTIYGNLCSTSTLLCTSYFRDIDSGKAGGNSAQAGWDFVTGVGSVLGLLGK
jgi:kumamolisin